MAESESRIQHAAQWLRRAGKRWFNDGVATALAMTLCAGLLLTWGVAQRAHRDIHEVAHSRFERLAERLTSATERRVNQIVLGLQGARGLYAASRSVERQEFRAYVTSRDMIQEFPGALGIGFIERVPRAELPNFLARERADEAPEFIIKTIGDEPDLYVIKYIDPLERNLPAWGYDVGSERTRRMAVERAVRTGQATLTGRIDLVQDDRSSAGFLYLLPVYRNGSYPMTPAERDASLVGLVYAPLLIDNLLAGIAESVENQLDIHIADGADPSHMTLLYDGDHQATSAAALTPGTVRGHQPSAARKPMFVKTRQVQVGGRVWLLTLSTAPSFETALDWRIPYLFGIVGVLLSVLATLAVWTLTTGRQRALALAQSMTVDLQKAKAQAEDALREAVTLRNIVNEYGLVTVTDARGKIIDANHAFCTITGYSREELLGKDHRLINSGRHTKQFWIELWKTVAQGKSWRGEVCNRTKFGAIFWADSLVAPFRDAEGRITKYVAIRTDITARKQVEADLLDARDAATAANRAKSEFLANMSHEIRTPLTAILGYADILRDDIDQGRQGPGQLAAVDTIRNAGQHLLTVINDVLDLSKIESGRMTVETIDTDLVSLLHEVESLMRPRAAGKGVKLNTRLESAVPARILSDPTRLRQILMNLVGNAAKFTEAGAITIVVRAVTAANMQRLQVDIEDTGPGMDDAQRSRLFMAFNQADSTVTRRHGGTGLGLVICRRLAELMGGKVVLLRSEPGVGSCFRIELPLKAAPGAVLVNALSAVQKPTVTAPQSTSQTLAGRVLLAEDGPANQRLLAHHLSKAGAQVTIADNGRIALEMLERADQLEEPFDLLVTDMQMPEMDGYTLARTLRKRGSTLAIVALTAHAMAEDRDKCLAAGCDDYASKPINKATLLATCAKWIGQPGGQGQANDQTAAA